MKRINEIEKTRVFGDGWKKVYHGPLHEVVFDHEVPNERGVDFAHVFVVVF